jgi:hypothetical protein
MFTGPESTCKYDDTTKHTKATKDFSLPSSPPRRAGEVRSEGYFVFFVTFVVRISVSPLVVASPR